MALTTKQKIDLIGSARLTWVFKMLLSEKKRELLNAVRKSVKDNNAENVYHAETVILKKDADSFEAFEKFYFGKLADEKGVTKVTLVNILDDFEWSSINESTTITDDVIESMSQETYSPIEGVDLNIFGLIVNQSYESFSQNIVLEEPNP